MVLEIFVLSMFHKLLIAILAYLDSIFAVMLFEIRGGLFFFFQAKCDTHRVPVKKNILNKIEWSLC